VLSGKTYAGEFFRLHKDWVSNKKVTSLSKTGRPLVLCGWDFTTEQVML
jgi:hypothetical protein